MSISVLNQSSALALTLQSLHLPVQDSGLSQISNKLLAQSIRRAVYISAPCSFHSVCESVFKALSPLTENEENIKEKIEEVLENLIAMGDIFYMEVEDGNVKNHVLRPAPPAYVLRRDKSILVLGVAGDDITPCLSGPIEYLESGLRIIRFDDVSRAELIATGVIELPESLWMHLPKCVRPLFYVETWIGKMPDVGASEQIEEVDILDSALPVTFYKGRWVPLNHTQTGKYVARRPQRFGAKLWSFVEVFNGRVLRLVDIHPEDTRNRACDVAWRLQAAIDAVCENPQVVKVFKKGLITRLSFTSPLPMWAVRRLAILGERVDIKDALFAFDILSCHADAEIQLLVNTMWLQPKIEENL